MHIGLTTADFFNVLLDNTIYGTYPPLNVSISFLPYSVSAFTLTNLYAEWERTRPLYLLSNFLQKLQLFVYIYRKTGLPELYADSNSPALTEKESEKNEIIQTNNNFLIDNMISSLRRFFNIRSQGY